MTDLPDVYLRFENIDGENMDSQHQKWCGITDFSWGFGLDAGYGDAGSTLSFKNVSISKRPDLTSKRLLELCHSGETIPSVEVEAVRYGGTDNDSKIPFFRMIFEGVHLKSCELKLTRDNPPEETIVFTYDVVRMESIWTDNETGNRVLDRPSRVGWNVKDKKPAVAPAD